MNVIAHQCNSAKHRHKLCIVSVYIYNEELFFFEYRVGNLIHPVHLSHESVAGFSASPGKTLHPKHQPSESMIFHGLGSGKKKLIFWYKGKNRQQFQETIVSMVF